MEKDWSYKINVPIAERSYPIRINPENEWDEERIRKAANIINKKVAEFRKGYQNKDVQDFLALIALQFAVKLMDVEVKMNDPNQVDHLKRLDQMLDDYLNRNIA